MTQRVRRAERLRRQRTDDRGLVYRGAHVYRWVDEARAMLAAAPEAGPTTLVGFQRAMAAEVYGITRSNVRSLAFSLGCHDLLADVLRDVPVVPPLSGLRAWVEVPAIATAYGRIGDPEPMREALAKLGLREVPR